MTTAISFPFASGIADGAARYLFPGSIEAPNGVFVASGLIGAIVLRPDAAADLLLELFDAHNDAGQGFGSTNRARYEIDVTGLAGLRGTTPNRFECYGTGVTNATFDNTNCKFRALVQNASDSQAIDVNCWFHHGMVARLTPVGAATTAAIAATIEYCPRELGSQRRKAATKGWGGPL